MPQLTSGNNAIGAWKNASKLVLASETHRIRNLIVEIQDPITFDRNWLRRFDPKSVGAKDRLSVVVKVLFPFSGKRANETRQQFYARWRKVLEKNRAKGTLHAGWGTYFSRLTAFNGNENQLEEMVQVLSQWKFRPEAAIVAHLSSATVDPLRPIGSPCLQYIEILWGRDDVIDLVAVYRNHDFLNKALGTTSDSGSFLRFISSESGKKPGRVVCHSVRAYCDEPQRLKSLIAK